MGDQSAASPATPAPDASPVPDPSPGAPESGTDVVKGTSNMQSVQSGVVKVNKAKKKICCFVCLGVCICSVLVVVGLILSMFFFGFGIFKNVEKFAEGMQELLKDSTTGATTDATSDPHKWFENGCWNYKEVCKGNSSKPKLVVFSFDGFAHSYLERQLVKNVENMAKCGVKAEQVLPSFPSKTLPNHYTIATGKYPGTHGILSSNIFDNGELVFLKKSLDKQYFTEDPIWNLYQQTKKSEKKKVGAYNWYGSWQHPDRLPAGLVPFNKTLNPTAKEKVDQIIDWMKSDTVDYGLLMAYFTNPDRVGHQAGPNSKKVNDSLVNDVDNVIGYFLNKLQENNLECTDFAIVSDHGMAKINKMEDLRRFGKDEITIDGGMVSAIYLKEGPSKASLRDSLLKDINCDVAVHKFTKENLPPRLHFAKNKRVPDITMLADLEVMPISKNETDKGDHGQDYLVKDMRTVFFAQGPSFKKNVVLPTFENVQYYGLFSEILGIDASEVPEHDGIYGSLRSALKNPKNTVDKFYAGTTPIGKCAEEKTMSICDATTTSATQKPVDFGTSEEIASPFSLHFKRVLDLCVKNWGKGTSTFYSGNDVPIFITSNHKEDEKELAKCANCWLSTDGCAAPEKASTNIAPLNTPIRRLKEASKEMFAGTKKLWDLLNTRTDKYVADSKTSLVIYTGEQENSGQRFFYRVIVGCSTPNKQPKDCGVSNLRVISFLVPNFVKNTFCYKNDDLLLIQYTARVIDIEKMTGLRFFMNLQKDNYESIVRLKTSPPLSLDFLTN